MSTQNPTIKLDECIELFPGLPIVFYRFIPDSGGVFYSQQVESLLGYPKEMLLADPMLWYRSIHPDDQGFVDAAIKGLQQGKESYDLEYRFLHKDGRCIWIHDRCFSRSSEDGKPLIIGIATDITSHRAVVMAQQDAQLRLQRVLDTMDVGVLLYESGRGQILDANLACSKIFGYSKDDFLRIKPEALHLEPAAYESFLALAENNFETSPTFVTEWPLKRENGAVFPAEIRIRHLADEPSNPLFVAAITDLTEKHAYEDGLALAHQVIENASEAIMITDEKNHIVSVNAAFTRITGWSEKESVGRNPTFLSSGKQSPEFYREMWRVLADTGSWQGEVINRRRNGQYYPEWLSISSVRNRQGKITNYLAIFADISERKRTEGLIHRYSWFDSLTDLPNKALLIDRISQGIITAQNEGKPLYLIALNLNRLKHINDSLGHTVGDEVLKIVATRLVGAASDGDTVSRLSGDDFVVISPRVHQPHKILAIAERMLEKLNEPMSIDGHTIEITANAGISLFPSDGSDPETLLMHAGAALNHARQDGPNVITFFEPHMNRAVVEKLNLQRDLKSALANHEFELYFQPQISLLTGELAGLEALIRWNHPERGQVSPGQFIPIAEDANLIIPIGQWVIEEACACLSKWRAMGFKHLQVAVNLSAHQFTPELPELVADTLNRYHIPPSHLELEITEGVVMKDAAEVLSRLQMLKAIGVNMSIDDFGTGYSSLTYLRRFPVDKLKIDQSFVRDILDSAEATSIVRMIIALGQSLSLKVIAEGVETAEQREILRELGCDEIQGYLVSRPISFDSMTEWLR